MDRSYKAPLKEASLLQKGVCSTSSLKRRFETTAIVETRFPGVDLPPEVLAACKPLHCGLCNASMNSPVMANNHYGGKGHEKKVRALMVGRPDCPGSSGSDPKQSAAAKGGTRRLTCSMCNVSVNHPAQLESHLIGKAHKRKLKQAQEEGDQSPGPNKKAKVANSAGCDSEPCNRIAMSRGDTRVHLISADPMRYCQALKGPLMSLDCEWVNTKAKANGKIALLQLADSYGTCLLLRLNILKTIPDYITSILTSTKILKVGVNIQGDISKLHHEYGVATRHWVDIRHLAQKSRPNMQKLGLASIAETFLEGVKMDKNWWVSASDWEAEELSPKQVSYAADDALVGVASVLAIAIQSLSDKPSSHSVFSSRDETYEEAVLSAEKLCQPFANTGFFTAYTPSSVKSESIETTSPMGVGKKSIDGITESDLSIYMTPSGDYYCLPCHLITNSDIQFKHHINSKKHKQKKDQTLPGLTGSSK